MVEREVFGGAAIGTTVPVPSQDVLLPHTLRIRSAESKKIVHEASGAVHWLISQLGLLLGGAAVLAVPGSVAA